MVSKKKGTKVKKNIREKTFAEKYWREFEKLSMLIIKSFYDHILEKKVILTEKNNDGGYDGVILFPNSSSTKSDIYKILIEAKLREPSTKDLPLSDFAKTAIISVNAVADKLYISTNLHFSPATKQKLKTFSKRTGIDIDTIDIKYIAKWLTEHHHLTSEINDILIKKICSILTSIDFEQIESVCDHFIPQNNYNLSPLIGQERVDNLNNSFHKIINANEDIIVSGQYGCGKSFFIRHLLEKLDHEGIQFISIDLKTNTTIRQIFICLLSNIWNVRAEDIYALTPKGLEDLSKPIAYAPLDTNTQITIISMIHWDEKKFTENIDVLGYILIEYLVYILCPMLKRVRYTLTLYNLAEADPTVLDFIIKFASKMKNERISFIYEVQDTITSDKVSLLKNKFKDICHIILKSWGHLETVNFLTVQFPNLEAKIIFKLAEILGGNPFLLSKEAGLLLDNQLYDLMEKGAFNPDILSNPKYISSYLENQFSSCLRDSTLEIVDLYSFLIYFEGPVSVGYLKRYFGKKKWNELLEKLNGVEFLSITDEYVGFKHSIFSKCAQNVFISLQIRSTKLGKWIIENITFVSKNIFLQSITIFEIAIKINDYILIKKLWQDVVNYYVLIADYKKALRSVDFIYNYLYKEGHLNEFTTLEKIALLVMILKIKVYMNCWNETDLNCQQNLLETEVNLYKEFESPFDLTFSSLIKEKIYIESKILLAKGKYNQMLQLIEEYEQKFMENTTIDRKIGFIMVMKVLGKKHCYGMDASFLYLRSIRKIYMDSPEIQLLFLSYLASYYTVTKPKNALKCFIMSEKYAKLCTLEDRFHCNNNIAMMHLYLNQMNLSTTLAAKIKLDAFCYNIPAEQGRAANTLGGLAWIQNNVDEAIKYFSEAYQIFDQIKHMTHIWPVLINLASIYFVENNFDKSLNFARMAVDILLKYHVSTAEKFLGPGKLKTKYYIGTLILINILYRLDSDFAKIAQLLTQINSDSLKVDFKNYVEKNNLSEFLNDSVYLLNGKHFLKV